MAVSVYQNSGDPNTNWAWFEQQKKAKANFRFRISGGAADDNDGLAQNFNSDPFRCLLHMNCWTLSVRCSGQAP